MKSKENSMSVKKSITDKSGFSKIQWCILLVVLALIMAFILSYVVAINIAQSQKKIATQALDAFIEDNAIRIYSEVKQNSDYTEELLEDEFLKKLVETNGLEVYGTDKYACKSADGRNTQYVITKPEMDFEEDYSAKVIIEYTISVPLEFNGRPAIWVDIPITVTSRFMPKYEAEEDQQDSDDRTPPSITISIPSGTSEGSPFVTPYDTVTVMGTVYDPELAMLSVAGDRISVTEGGAFKQIVDLQGGMNIIPVVATDRMGNTTTKYVYVSKEGVIPLDVTVEDYNGVYDGNPHKITVTCAQNAVITYATSEDGSYTNVNPTFTNAGTYRVYYRVEKEGYGTVQDSALVKIEKADNVFSMSNANGSKFTVRYPGSDSTFVTQNLSGGKVSAVSSDASIISLDTSDLESTGRISAVRHNKAGTVTVTITTAETANYKSATWLIYYTVNSCAHESLAFGEGYKAATCTEVGYSGDTYCMTCGDLIETGTTIAALGHDYSAKSTDATYRRSAQSCTAAATYYHKCSRCPSKGTTYWTSGSAAGHNWSAVGTQKSAATCTANSTNWKKCSVCGTQSSTDYWTNSDALGHDYSQQGSLYSNATCTAAAVYNKKCSRCSSQSGTMSVGNALGHDYSQQGSLYSNATCTAAAVYYKKCSRCSSQSGTMSVGNALGHDHSYQSTDSAYLASSRSCTSNQTYYYKCQRCSSKGSSTWTYAYAYGHSDPGVSCTANVYCANGCGTLMHYAAGHTGGAATCTSHGYCGRCGTLMNYAYGHSDPGVSCTANVYCAHGCGTLLHYAAGHTGGAATCTSNGYCGRCGVLMNYAYGHRDPGVSCTENRYCANGCGTLYHYAAGHTGGAATCTSNGYCGRCGVLMNYALGHNPSGTVTSYNNSYHYQNCSRCGTSCATAHSKSSECHYNDKGQHWNPCTGVYSNCWFTYNLTTHKYDTIVSKDSAGHTKRCSACWHTVSGEAHSWTYEWLDLDYHLNRCTICSYSKQFIHLKKGSSMYCSLCGGRAA